MIWQNRKVKIDRDGTWMLSAEGRHDDWDFAPQHPWPGMAVAGMVPAGGFLITKTARIVYLNASQLLFVGFDGTHWILTGNPCLGGRFDPADVLEAPR